MKDFFIGYFLVVIFLLIGYVLNIVQLVKLGMANDFSAMFILKIAGAFLGPVGSVLGYIGLF